MRRTVPLLDGIAESRSEVRHSKPRAEYGEDTAIPFMNVWAVLLIELYQRKTANRPHVCNFCPSCSEYSRIAFMRYRFLPAFFMTLERLQECSDFFTEWPKQNKPRGKEMSDLKLMACPYCGSPLTPRENDGWYCDGCGRTSVFDREKKITNNIYIQKKDDEPVRREFSLSYSGKEKSFGMKRRAEIIFSYKPRANLRDLYPMKVEVTVEGRTTYEISDFVNVGNGKAVIEQEDGNIIISSEGKIELKSGSGPVKSEEVSPGSSYSVGPISIVFP